MHRGELIEELRLDDLNTRLKEFSTKGERQNTARQQHDKTKPQVKRADVFVVRSKEPAA
jgi:hypothetical protein